MENKRKRRSQGGFTLGEVLVAILILLMMSTIVAAGIPLAKRAYDKVTIGANAQVLMSTAVNVLRDELGTAQNVSVDMDADIVTYYNPNNHSYSKLSKNTVNGSIMLNQNMGVSLTATGELPLISPERATNDMYVQYMDVSEVRNSNNQVEKVIFENIKVVRPLGAAETSTMAELPSLTIRIISAS